MTAATHDGHDVAAWAIGRLSDQLINGYGFGDPADDQAGWQALLLRCDMPADAAEAAAVQFGRHAFCRSCAGVRETRDGLALTRQAITALATRPECRRDLDRLVDRWTHSMIHGRADEQFEAINGVNQTTFWASALTTLADGMGAAA